MNHTFILSSVTYALKGKKLLKGKGIKVSLVKSGNIKELRGCGYGLTVPADQKEQAESLLISSGIRIISNIGDIQ